MEINNLPKLKPQQQAFVMQHVLLMEKSPSEAYKFAYNTQNMNSNSISVEAQKLLKNPKITLWLDYYRQHAQKTIDTEFEYGMQDAFKELNELQQLSMESYKTYNIARACIDSKCKIKGLYNEKPLEVNANVVMPNLTVSGENVKFKIGSGDD